MTLNAKLDRAVKSLFIEDVVLKSIDARLSDEVRPGINLFPNDRVSIQMRGPTCVADQAQLALTPNDAPPSSN